jgi:cellulose synthase/poly-beta-1,6-N-acetylglucosamine synthase-like glycosyltransferase
VTKAFGWITGAALAATSSASALFAGYLGVISVAGTSRARTRSTPGSRRTRFVILVPAHNEGAVIADAVRSLKQLAYDAHLFQVHVVADNCSDDTADIVRSLGCHVHERGDTVNPGKGPALNWLFDRVDASEFDFDVTVVVDADSIVDPEFLSAMDHAFANGAIVAQGFYSVREPEASAAAGLRFSALACRHHLRPLGRSRLGASVGLYGNGMAFERTVLRRRRWSGHLVEDAEFQMELLLNDGVLVTYVPDARLEAEMPKSLEAATSQNARWERGRIEVARRYVPTLVHRLGRGPMRRRIAFVDAIADLLVPPLSVLVLLQTVSLAGNLASSVAGSPRARRRSLLDAIALSTVVLHVVAGLRAVGAPRSVYASLSGAPRMIAWKLGVWLRALGPGSEVTWQRTQRNSEH